MGARHEQQASEAAFKKGGLIGGDYQVHSLLGRGGFGEVYLVYSLKLRTVLALKTFRQEFFADADVKENFKREALLWVNLGVHPFILAARLVEEFSGRLFVAMDYIAPDDRGRVSLADHLAHAGAPLDTNLVLQWAIMFCYGMEHANRRGIKCHRDLKPANILIRQDGTLLVSDFGLAAAVEVALKGRGRAGLRSVPGDVVGLSLFQTEGKKVCGTPGYVAPEILRGEGADVPSDIYSFGLVLWQMATGSQVPPFAVGVAPPRSPSDLDRYAVEIYAHQMRKRAPAVGEPLGAVIDRCLSAEPSRRFGSFTELRSDLEEIMYHRTGRTVKLPPVGEQSLAFWNNKGLSLLHLGRLEEAAACLRKAVEINPDAAAAHINLGNALRAKGDLDGAIAECRTAVRLQPDFAAAYSDLGTALQAKGDLDGAIGEFRTTLRLQPDDAIAHTNLGNALRARGDLEGTIAEYRTAVRLQPGLTLAHDNLGSALQDKGDLDGAIAEYRTALRLQPDYADAHINLGTALRARGDVEGAIAEYRTTLRLQPDHVLAHNNLGNALADKGDVEGAIAEYRATLRLQPDHVIAYNNLGNALRDRGDLEGAIAEFRTALRLKPNYAIAHCNLGNALAVRGDREEALEEFRKAYMLAPNHPAIRQIYESLMPHLKR
jgi:tetratricopeptide (TPR) repeat protein